MCLITFRLIYQPNFVFKFDTQNLLIKISFTNCPMNRFAIHKKKDR